MTNIPLKNPSLGIKNKSRKICLYAAAGMGKSASVATLLLNAPKDRRLIYLMTERNAPYGFEWGLKNYKITVKPYQVFYVIPEERNDPFENLDRAITNFSTKPQEVRHSVTDTGNNKEKYTFFRNVISEMKSFSGIDYSTGETHKLGSFDKLSTNDFVIIDGLSPIANEVWNTIYGDVLVHSGYDYSAPQRMLYQILFALSKIEANVILLAHEKDFTEGEGLQQKLKYVGPDTKVGNANFESIMGLFTDVIRATRFGTKYVWETKRSDKVFVICREGIPEKSATEGLLANFSLLPCFKDET